MKKIILFIINIKLIMKFNQVFFLLSNLVFQKRKR